MPGYEVELDNASHATRIDAKDLVAIWSAAARSDDTLAIHPRDLGGLAAKRVPPERFSRTALFDRMADCRPVLFTNCPIRPMSRDSGGLALPALLERLATGFPRSKRARVRTRDTIDYLPIRRVLERWTNGKSTFGVTDLHYVDTRFDAWIDTSRLNDFNLLPRGAYGFQSQDSLVISSEGAVTDSHSDDHSGSNHCFTGAKIWLLWDTIEGLERGIEDVERRDVIGRAAFDLPTFLDLRSSRWILIGSGQTMFIPAHLSHKVVTLRRYLGLGSFHAGLPGFFDLLMRWRRLPPLWESGPGGDRRHGVGFLTRRAIRKIEYLRTAGRADRLRWGVPALKRRMRHDDVDRIVSMPCTGQYPDAPAAFVRAARRL